LRGDNSDHLLASFPHRGLARVSFSLRARFIGTGAREQPYSAAGVPVP